MQVDYVYEASNIWCVAKDGSFAYSYAEAKALPRGTLVGGTYYQIPADSKEQAFERLEQKLANMATVRGRTIVTEN